MFRIEDLISRRFEVVKCTWLEGCKTKLVVEDNNSRRYSLFLDDILAFESRIPESGRWSKVSGEMITVIDEKIFLVSPTSQEALDNNYTGNHVITTFYVMNNDGDRFRLFKAREYRVKVETFGNKMDKAMYEMGAIDEEGDNIMSPTDSADSSTDGEG